MTVAAACRRLSLWLSEAPRTRSTTPNTTWSLTPTYRKWILRGDLHDRVRERFAEIAQNHDIEIDTREVTPNHVHLFVSFPPRLSIAQVGGTFKAGSALLLFREFPELKRQLWGGEFGEDDYFVRTVGDEVTADVIRRYVEYHRGEEKKPSQLSLF